MGGKKGLFYQWRVFGLSLWNINVDAVVHGKHTSDKTKGQMINVSGKFATEVEVKNTHHGAFFYSFALWGDFKMLSTAVSSISRNTLMFSWTMASEELGVFRSFHKDNLMYFHRIGGHSAFSTWSYQSFSPKNFLN